MIVWVLNDSVSKNNVHASWIFYFLSYDYEIIWEKIVHGEKWNDK